MPEYKIIRDALNGNRFQVRVKAYPDGVTALWCDAGDACDTQAEAEVKMAEFAAQHSTVIIGRTTYTVEPMPDTEEDMHTAYKLTGPRGAVYYAMRNVHHPKNLFLVNGRNFTSSTPCEWLREIGPSELKVMR